MTPTTRTRPHQRIPVRAQRPSAERRSAPERPLLTSDGRFLMQLRLRHLMETEIPQARAGLGSEPSEPGPVSRLERLCVEAIWLQRLLQRAGTLPRPSGRSVELGSYVRIRMIGGDGTWVRPVPAVEAMLDDDRLSATSPLGAALLGARPGDQVVVHGPAGPWTCEVLEIAPGDPEALAAAG